MNRIITLVLLILCSHFSNAQNLVKEKFQINGGIGLSGFGLPIYGGFDYGLTDDVTVGAEGSFRSYSNFGSNASLVGIGANINYHFNRLFKLKNDRIDVYGGGTLGYWFWSWDFIYPDAKSSGIGISAQLGGRYFLSKNFGLNLEIGGGTISGGKFGLTYRL